MAIQVCETLQLSNSSDIIGSDGCSFLYKNLTDLRDVNTTGIADGNTLVWNIATSTWVPTVVSVGGTEYTAGNGIDLTGDIIAVTSACDAKWSTDTNTIYEHPITHPASIITQDSSNRFVTDVEKSTWNNKQDSLISGTSIKTVNGTSLLGSGDLTVAGGGGASAICVITENTKTGYGTCYRAANLGNYGDIGNSAVDLSYSDTTSTTRGATGDYSTAIGFDTTASGSGSLAIGCCTIAAVGTSFAAGTCSLANCWNSAAIGYKSNACGWGSFAFGHELMVTGSAALAIGCCNISYGTAAIATGIRTCACGCSSTTMGYSTLAIGDYSIATGFNTKACGISSISIGTNTRTFKNNSVVLGSCTQIGSTSAKMFAIGNGTDVQSTTTNDYNVHFSVDCNGLTCIKQLKIVDGTQGAGKVLTSGVDGLATWATPSGGGTTYTAGNAIDLTGDVIAIVSECDTKWSVDTVYTHPVNHPASVIIQDSNNRFVTDVEKSTWNNKQDSLISGTNIKTVNGTSLLGGGDITMSGGGLVNFEESVCTYGTTTFVMIGPKMVCPTTHLYLCRPSSTSSILSKVYTGGTFCIAPIGSVDFGSYSSPTVGGLTGFTTSQQYVSILSGWNNCNTAFCNSSIVSGVCNYLGTGSCTSVIVSGCCNNVSSYGASVIVGGIRNMVGVSAGYGVCGICDDTIGGTVINGYANSICFGIGSIILSGLCNRVGCNGINRSTFDTIINGYYNSIYSACSNLCADKCIPRTLVGKNGQLGCGTSTIFGIANGTTTKANTYDDYNLIFSVNCYGVTTTKGICIVDGTQGAGRVLTSDANGLASWVAPSSGGGAAGIYVITENGKTGYGTCFRATNPGNYGDIGTNAVDLSFSDSVSTTRGATGDYSTAMGYNTCAIGDFSTSMGTGTKTYGSYSTAVGYYTTACGDSSISIGREASTCGIASMAIGCSVESNGNFSVAMGFGSRTFGSASISMGDDSRANGDSSIAMGRNACTVAIGSVALSGGNYCYSFSNPMQTSTILLVAKTTSTAATVATVTGATANSTNSVIISNNSAMSYRLMVLAKKAGAGASNTVKAFEAKGILARGVGAETTVLIGANITEIGGTLPCSISVTVDTTLGALKIEVASGSNEVIYWEIRADTVEITGYTT